jgi:hypothetical protein
MGYSTKSVLFNGTTQYGTAGDVFDFERTSPFSLSAWVKSSTATGGFIISKRDELPGAGYYTFLSSSGAFSFNIASDLNAPYRAAKRTTASGLNDGGWHHLVATWDGNLGGNASGITLYVDGQIDSGTILYDTLTGSTLNTASLNLASRTNGAASFLDAYVDEVAVYDKKLTADEVQRIYNLGNPSDLQHAQMPSNLVWWCRMGENGSATVLTDEAGGGPNDYSPLTKSMQIGTGGAGDQQEGAIFPDPLALPATGQPFTMGCWVKGGTDGRTLVSKTKSGSGRQWGLWVTSTRIQPSWTDNDYDRQYRWANVAILDGNWHHVVWTYDGVDSDGHTIYVDGTPYSVGSGGSQSGGYSTPGSDGSFAASGIWQNSGISNGYYLGRLCHSFLYDKELSAAEVAAIYGGVPQDLSSVGPTTNLKHWSALGDGCALGSGNMVDLSGEGNHGTFFSGESNDFVLDVPMGGYPLTLVNSPTIATDAPEDDSNQFASYYEDPGEIQLYTFQQDTFPQYSFSSYHEDPSSIPVYTWQQTWEWLATFYFRMRATDITCPEVQQPAYVYWTVEGCSDWNADQLDPGDLPCGTDPSTDLDDIQIAAAWTEL